MPALSEWKGVRAAREMVSDSVYCGVEDKALGFVCRRTRVDIVCSTRRNRLSPVNIDLRRRVRIWVDSLPDRKQSIDVSKAICASTVVLRN